MIKRNIYVLYAIALLHGMVFYGPIATLYRQAAGIGIFLNLIFGYTAQRSLSWAMLLGAAMCGVSLLCYRTSRCFA